MHVLLASRWLPGAVRHPAGNAPFFLEVGSGNGPHHRAGPMLHCLPDTPPRGTAGGSGTGTLSPPRTGPLHRRGDRCPRPARSLPLAAARPAPELRGHARETPGPEASPPGSHHEGTLLSPRRPPPRSLCCSRCFWPRGVSTPTSDAADRGRSAWRASSGPAAAGPRLSLSVTRCLALSFQVLPVLLTCQTLEICS